MSASVLESPQVIWLIKLVSVGRAGSVITSMDHDPVSSVPLPTLIALGAIPWTPSTPPGHPQGLSSQLIFLIYLVLIMIVIDILL